MKRFPAMLLLAFFSFSLIGPAVFADSDSQLPECCRRLGSHHCAMMQAMARDASSGPAVTSAGDRCPYGPCGCCAPGHEYSPGLSATQTVAASLVSHPAGREQTEARYRVSFSRSWQKRGPPTLLS